MTLQIKEKQYPALNMVLWGVFDENDRLVSPAFRSQQEAEVWYTEHTGQAAPAPTQPEPTLVDMPTPGTTPQPQTPGGIPMGLLVAGAAVGIFMLMMKD